MTIGQKRRSKRSRARREDLQKKTKRNAKIRRRGVRADRHRYGQKNAPVARVTSQEKPKNATCKEKSTSVGNARIVFAPHPSARSRPCLVPEVQRLDILRSLVRHLER